MPKGYWVVRVDISETRRLSSATSPPTPRRSPPIGGRFVVRGGRSETPEGKHRARNVVVEFPSFQAARDCYHSAGLSGGA